MQLRVDVHRIGLDEVASGGIVAFALDALDLGEKLGEQAAQGLIVVDHEIGLAVYLLLFDDVPGGAFLVAPFSDELAVLHMGLGVLLAEFHPGELGHDAIAYITGILRLVRILVRHDAEFHHLGIGAVVQAEEVGAGFLEGALVFTECGGGDTGQKLAGAVSEALVEVGVDLIHVVAVLLDHVDFVLVVCKLLEHAVRTLEGRGVIGVGDVGYGHALGAVFLAYPVGIGQIDADGGGGITCAGEHHGIDYLGGNALAFRLLEACVHGRIVLEPLRVGTEQFGAGRSGGVLDVDNALPGGLMAERVVVVLDEAVHVVDNAEGVLHPLDIVFVPHAQVAGLIVLQQQVDALLLALVLDAFAGLAQFGTYLLQGLAIGSADRPDIFHHVPRRILYHLGIQAVGYRVRVAGDEGAGVEGFGIRAGHPHSVEIDG